MKIEDQVVSLKLSKKLKELGVNQESLFYWVYDKDLYYHGKKTNLFHVQLLNKEMNKLYDESYSAFTTEELIKMIPKHLTFIIDFDPPGIFTIRFWENEYDHAIEISNESLTNLIAKMIIYLIENNLYKKEC